MNRLSTILSVGVESRHTASHGPNPYTGQDHGQQKSVATGPQQGESQDRLSNLSNAQETASQPKPDNTGGIPDPVSARDAQRLLKALAALERIRDYGKINTGNGFTCHKMAASALAEDSYQTTRLT